MVSADDFPEPTDEPAKPAAPVEDDATRYIRVQPGATLRTAPGTARGGGRLHLAPGQLLAHTYEIEALLGRGGMGEVYRARHIKLHSLHAIKVIAPELVNDARVVEMFTEEARKLRLVRDDAVVSYDGLIGDEDGLLYLIMEFVDGVSLAKIIRERKLTPSELRRLRDRLAQGLGAAHDKLIYHRDISPDNIILVDGNVDQAKIIDFGIAKSAAAGDRTVIGNDFAGKYSYVSPEQLGMFGGNVDGRSDIYSLGLVIAAAGLGHGLDMGNSPATAVEARRHVPDLAPLPSDLRAELAPLLEPDPADRPRSMRELPGSEDGGPVTTVPRAATTRSAARQPPPPAPRSRLPLLLGGAAALIVLLGVVVYLLLPGTQAPSRSTASVTAGGSATPSPPPAAPTLPPSSIASLPPPQTIDPAALSTRLTSIARSLRCADLKPNLASASDPGIAGFVTSAADQSRVGQMLGDIPSLQRAASVIAVRPWPQCDQVLKFVEDAGGFDDIAAAPRLDFNVPSLDYHLGDKLVLKVMGSATSDGFLYVDFLDSAGNIAHLFPRLNGPSNAVRAGQTVTLGESKDSILEIAEPIGPNLVLAIFSPQRLFATRDDEAAQTYLPALSRSLASPARPKAAYAFVNALAR
jgi:eukaryotic-like serine/threonine-protein kinase